MPLNRWKLSDIDVGGWAFYPQLSDDDHARLQASAKQWGVRHGARMRVRRGHQRGVWGTWVERSDRPASADQRLAVPVEGEVGPRRRPNWPVDRAHYHGAWFIPLTAPAESPELEAELHALEVCARNYQRKHGIRFKLTPKVFEERFGMLVEVDDAPEII